MAYQDRMSMYNAMDRSIKAAIESGALDEEAQAALTAGALELSRKIDHASFGASEHQLKMILDYCKALGIAPTPRNNRGCK